MRSLYLGSCGIALAVFGGYQLLVLIAFASIMDPRIEGWECWSLTLQKLFDPRDALRLTLLLSLLTLTGLTLVGLAWRLRDPAPGKPEGRASPQAGTPVLPDSGPRWAGRQAPGHTDAVQAPADQLAEGDGR